MSIFQFTPLREGRRKITDVFLKRMRYFNSRPSARGDVYVGTKIPKEGLFQFTPLREGRHIYTAEKDYLPNFNSRPSARGDAINLAPWGYFQVISIHAPPRGATYGIND